MILSQRGESERERHRYQVELEPRERWELQLDVVPCRRGGSRRARRATLRRRARARPRLARRLAAAGAAAPRRLGRAAHSFGQSVADLAALRMRSAPTRAADAAGGRDAVVHDRLRPRHDHHLPADAALRPGARAHGARGAGASSRRRRTTRRSTPSRARSSTRCGRARPRRTGSARTTARSMRRRSTSCCCPRSGGGRTTPCSCSSLKEPAMRALEWIDRYGDRDGDGFVEYERRASAASRTSRGRTPATRSASPTAGSQRRSRRARCRATSTTRSAASPSSRARCGATASSRSVSSREADELRDRFDEAFWVDERGGYYALALDGDKRRVDSLCSNIGHLLWSGIVPPDRADAVVDALMGDALWSGWGVRTMSDAGRRLQPALVPQRHRLAARQLPDRVGARALRALAGGAADRAAPARGGTALRLPAARGLRRPAALRDDVPDRLPDRGASAGMGGRDAGAAAAAAARPPARPCGGTRSRPRAAGAADLGAGARLSGVRAFDRQWDVRLDERPSAGRGEHERPTSDRGPRAAVVRGAADRLRRDRVGRLAARRRARRRRPRRDAVRVRRLAATRAKLSAVFETAPSEQIGRTYWELRHVSPATSATASST